MAKKTKKEETEVQKASKGSAGLFIPAGLFIGMGIGFATNQLVPGLFIGPGAGFLAMAIAFILKRK